MQEVTEQCLALVPIPRNDYSSKKRPIPLLVNILKKIKMDQNENVLKFKSLCLFKFVRYEKDYDLTKMKLIINDMEMPFKIKFKKGFPLIKGYKLNFYEFEIPLDKINEFDIQNKLILEYDEIRGRILYNILDHKKGKNRNSKIFIKGDTSIYFRQTLKNTMYVTIREKNFYDTFKGKAKLFFARMLAKVYLKNDIILLYEKESSRYEESASVLYEKLIDNGYKNCYYIINQDNKALENLEPKYLENIIYKNSFKHILYFFKCKKFIGTETIGHALQLRIANRHAVKKYNSKDLSYVFLQHGVMYMISLNSSLRSGFRKMKYKFYRTVVSSDLEAEHFITLGKFPPENLYKTGLAKFDRSVLNKDADKIIIIPTWRRWEANQAREDVTKTNYYNMIARIVEKVPKNLLDKLIILPHPLMIDAVRESKSEMTKYIPEGITYNEILKECKLLITDYSSISYDAFYRGSNVIFYWEEKDECMEHYGKRATLMLTEDLAFGDICYDNSNLENIIKRNYYGEQEQRYKNRYKQIVEFDDNKNTDRIVELLLKDGIIKKGK